MLSRRMLTVVIWVPILIGILLLSHTILFDFLAALLCAFAVFELLRACDCHKNRWVLFSSLSYAFASPLLQYAPQWIRFGAVYLFIFALFAILIVFHETLDIGQIAMAFTFAYFIPMALGSLVLIRRMNNGEHLIYLAFMIPWFTDSFAYIFGCLFGKKKLCPLISPKKTVAGAIGGCFGGLFALVLFGAIMKFVFNHQIVHWELAIFCVLFATVASQMGDLAASVVKRKAGLKDFGDFFPGHGGVMDRFDSVVFVAPILYLFLNFATILI